MEAEMNVIKLRQSQSLSPILLNRTGTEITFPTLQKSVPNFRIKSILGKSLLTEFVFLLHKAEQTGIQEV